MSDRLERQPTWQARVREPSLTLLVWLLLLTFGMTPLVGLGVIGQLAAGVMWTLLGVLSVLVLWSQAAVSRWATLLARLVSLPLEGRRPSSDKVSKSELERQDDPDRDDQDEGAQQLSHGG